MCIVGFNEIPRAPASPKPRTFRRHPAAMAAESFAFLYAPKAVDNCLGHFQMMQAPPRAEPMKIRLEKSGVTGTVCELDASKNYGRFNIDGRAEPLFFHASQLIGCGIDELLPGDACKFDIVYNPKSAKFLAHTVKRVAAPAAVSGHFQMEEPAKFTVGPDATAARVHLKSVSGKVCEINVRQGFGRVEIAGQSKPLFFHHMQLIGCDIDQLAVGDVMKFDVIFNPKSEKFLARGVKRVRVDEKVGHFQSMQPAKFVCAAPKPAKSVIDAKATGKITQLGAHVGFITCGGDRVFFHEFQLVGCGISDLQLGQKMQFRLVFDNAISQRKIAEEVKICAAPIAALPVGHFLDVQPAIPTKTAAKPTTTPISTTPVQGRVLSVGNDYGFLQVENGDRVFFHSSALTGCHISEVKVDSRVSCLVCFNNFSKQKVAKQVKVHQPEIRAECEDMSDDEPVVVAPKLDFLQVQGSKFLRRLSQNIAINVEQTPDGMDCGGEEVKSIFSLNPAAVMRKDSVAMLVDVLASLGSRAGSRVVSRAASRRGSIF